MAVARSGSCDTRALQICNPIFTKVREIALDDVCNLAHHLGIPASNGVDMGAVRIAVVNDDRLFCDGLCQILRADPSFLVSVYGEGIARGHGDVDIRVMDARSDARVSPVVTACRGLRPHVVVVNAPEDDAWAADALGMGVRGILSRDSGADDLVKAIRVVDEGGIWARRRWLNGWRATRASSSSAASGGPSRCFSATCAASPPSPSR